MCDRQEVSIFDPSSFAMCVRVCKKNGEGRGACGGLLIQRQVRKKGKQETRVQDCPECVVNDASPVEPFSSRSARYTQTKNSLRAKKTFPDADTWASEKFRT